MLASENVQFCEPWEAGYRGDDATGKHVLALWKFDSGGETADASGHQHELKLDWAVIHPDGRFGCCLESFAGHPLDDKRICDPEGREAEYRGYYAAVDGKLAVTLDIAANDARGMWTITARDWPPGTAARSFFRVLGPEPWPPVKKNVGRELANPVQPKG